jgi:hypothetical protein
MHSSGVYMNFLKKLKKAAFFVVAVMVMCGPIGTAMAVKDSHKKTATGFHKLSIALGGTKFFSKGYDQILRYEPRKLDVSKDLQFMSSMRTGGDLKYVRNLLANSDDHSGHILHSAPGRGKSSSTFKIDESDIIHTRNFRHPSFDPTLLPSLSQLTQTHPAFYFGPLHGKKPS